MKGVKSRIKKVFIEKLENVGKPMGKILRENGYADNTADNPDHVTKTKSWEILLNEYIPESLIAKTHKEAFEATKTISAKIINSKGSQEANSQTDDFIDVPDWQTRMKATELGYKLRGRLIDKNIIAGDEDHPIHIDATKTLEKIYGDST